MYDVTVLVKFVNRLDRSDYAMNILSATDKKCWSIIRRVAPLPPHPVRSNSLVFDFIQSHVRWRGLETSAPMRGWDCAIRFEIQISLPRSSRIEQAGPISLSCRIPGIPYLDNRLRPPRWRRKRERCIEQIAPFPFFFFFFFFLRILRLLTFDWTNIHACSLFFSLPFRCFFRFDIDSPDTSLLAQPRPHGLHALNRTVSHQFAKISEKIRELTEILTNFGSAEKVIEPTLASVWRAVRLPSSIPFFYVDRTTQPITPLIWRGTVRRIARIVHIKPETGSKIPIFPENKIKENEYRKIIAR